MTKEEFKEELKKLGISKKEFAKLSGTAYITVNNWNDSNKPIPKWVESWLQNYIKAQTYEEVKDKLYEVFKFEKGQ